jgi:hypothetical protein
MPMNELWWLYRHPRRMLGVWWRGLDAKVHSDVALWFDVRGISPLAVLAALNCVAGLMAIQERAAGTFLKLSDLRMCIAAAAATLLIIASRWLLRRLERQPPAFWIRSLLAAASILPPVTLLTTSATHNSLWAAAVVFLLAIVSANANALWNFCFESGDEPFLIRPKTTADPLVLRVLESPPRREICDSMATLPTDQAAERQPEPLETRRVANACPMVPSSTLAVNHSAADDWQERTIGQSGRAVVRGKLTAAFLAGQSQATLHIPFVPPFAVLPEFSCKVVDAPGVRARTPAVYRYGARIELKRSANVEAPQQVAVEFCALAAGLANRAA